MEQECQKCIGKFICAGEHLKKCSMCRKFHKALESKLQSTSSTNMTKTKISGKTLESDIICMYCKKGSSGKCTECFYNKYEDFKGRKLSVIC